MELNTATAIAHNVPAADLVTAQMLFDIATDDRGRGVAQRFLDEATIMRAFDIRVDLTARTWYVNDVAAYRIVAHSGGHRVTVKIPGLDLFAALTDVATAREAHEAIVAHLAERAAMPSAVTA